jgi:hypothetical protein
LTIFCHNVEQITTKNGLGTPIENWIEYPSLKEINNSPRTQIRCYEVKVVGNLGPLTEERDVVDISHCVREKTYQGIEERDECCAKTHSKTSVAHLYQLIIAY